MPEFQVSGIIKKIERTHRSKEFKFLGIPAIIAKFTDWDLSSPMVSNAREKEYKVHDEY